MHCGGVRQNRLDISKIDADRHGAGSLQRALFSEFDEALAIKLWKTKMSKSFVQEDEAGSLGTTNVLPDLFQVLAMKRDEIAEKLDVARLARRCWFLAIDAPLDIDAPFLRVLSAEKCLVDIFPLSSDLDSPGALFRSGDRCHSCTEASKSRKKRPTMAKNRVHTTRPNDSNVFEKCS